MLRSEHEELRRILDDVEQARSEEQRSPLIASLCDKARLHYTLEVGVFLPAIAFLPSDVIHLENAGKNFAAALALINAMGCRGTRSNGFLELIEDLRLLLMDHVATAEAPGGIFALALTRELDWAALEHRLAARRNELTGCAGFAVRRLPYTAMYR